MKANNIISAAKITKKEFNNALVENTTAQIYGHSSTYNYFNDIVAAINDAEKMKNVKDNAEWRTVTKKRANGVTFSNGSTLDYAPNNCENNVTYYRVGNVIVMIAAKKNDASDYERNPYIYLIVAYLIDTPEINDNTTPANDTTMTTTTTPATMNETNTVEFSELSHAATNIVLTAENDGDIYRRYVEPLRVSLVKKIQRAINPDPKRLAQSSAMRSIIAAAIAEMYCAGWLEGCTKVTATERKEAAKYLASVYISDAEEEYNYMMKAYKNA